MLKKFAFTFTLLSWAEATHVRKFRHPKSSSSITPEEYIFTLGGTENMGSQEVSNGNVNPEVSLPWGFNGWSPQTYLDANTGFWFYSEATHFYGIRCTKQPSPWIKDYGNFRFMAHLVDPTRDTSTGYSPYNTKNTDWSPYHFETKLLAYGNSNGYTTMEVTPTMHGSLMRVKFPQYAQGVTDTISNQTRRLMFALDNPDSDSLTITNDAANNQIVVEGYSTANNGGVPDDGSFKHYFYATIQSENVTSLSVDDTVVRNDDSLLWGNIDLDCHDTDGTTMIVRVATSLISADQAKFNHASEVDQVDFDDAVTNAKSLWNQEMSRVKVNDVGDFSDGVDKLTVFYSAMYRAAKYPRVMWETDPNSPGSYLHWSPYTGEVLPGRFSSDQGFWDAYRTTYSLLALWRPSQLANQMDGWLNAWREGGWVPQWSSPGYRGDMTGTMSDVSMSEAIVKLPHCGSDEADEKGYCVDAPTLLEASLQNAFQVPINTAEGRDCLKEYIAFGYVPQDAGCDAVVSRTLNYYHSDWALSQAAALLGDPSAGILLARSQNWTKLLNPTTGFLAPKYMDGSFKDELFDQFLWGNSAGYTESGPWQYRLEVPYDPNTLQSVLAELGIDAADVIEQANAMDSLFLNAGNAEHEQAEMAINCFGQWALNNQPVFAQQAMQIAFDTSVTGTKANRAQSWLRQSLDLFTATTDMYPGDEDNGSMGAWYVLNALGLYPLSPASGDYVIGSPQFANVTILIGGEELSDFGTSKQKTIASESASLTISASNQGTDNVYVQSVTWNGVAVEGVYISYADLMLGGELHFVMGSSPVNQA